MQGISVSMQLIMLIKKFLIQVQRQLKHQSFKCNYTLFFHQKSVNSFGNIKMAKFIVFSCSCQAHSFYQLLYRKYSLVPQDKKFFKFYVILYKIYDPPVSLKCHFSNKYKGIYLNSKLRNSICGRRVITYTSKENQTAKFSFHGSLLTLIFYSSLKTIDIRDSLCINGIM